MSHSSPKRDIIVVDVFNKLLPVDPSGQNRVRQFQTDLGMGTSGSNTKRFGSDTGSMINEETVTYCSGDSCYFSSYHSVS